MTRAVPLRLVAENVHGRGATGWSRLGSSGYPTVRLASGSRRSYVAAMTSWHDPMLARLRAAHLKALSAWHEVAPDTEEVDPALTEQQRAAMEAAMRAEYTYVDRLRTAGLIPHCRPRGPGVEPRT